MSLSRKGSGPLGLGSQGSASAPEEPVSAPVHYTLLSEAAANTLSAMTINLSDQALTALQEAAACSSESDCVATIQFSGGPLTNSLVIGSSSFTFKATDEKGRTTELYAEEGPVLKKICDISSKLVINRVLDKQETEKIKQSSIQRIQEAKSKHRSIQAPDLEKELNRSAKRVKTSAASSPVATAPSIPSSAATPSPSARARGAASTPSAPAAESPSGGSLKDRIVTVLRANPKGLSKAELSALLSVPPARLTALVQVADYRGGAYVLKGPPPPATNPIAATDAVNGANLLTPRAHEVKHKAHELAAASPPTTRSSSSTDGAAAGSGLGAGAAPTPAGAEAEVKRNRDLMEGLDLTLWNKNAEPATYEKIETRAQYDRYKDEYKRKYALYRELDRRLQHNSSEFDQLGQQIKAAKDKEEKKRLKALVQDLFNARNPAVQQMLQMYKVLHVDLSALRERVDTYVDTYRATNGHTS